MTQARIGIIGATGAVGQEVLDILKSRGFPFSELVLFASSSSAGKEILFAEKSYRLQEASKENLQKCKLDIVFMCASSAISRDLSPFLQSEGVVVIDNSSEFRMHKNVPLVIPEINAEDIEKHEGIIANPNCSTIILLMAIFPIHSSNPIQKIIVSTYQAVSGAGNVGMQELEQQTLSVLEGTETQSRIFPHKIAFNVFSHDSAIDPVNLHNEEEVKMINETQKILHNESISLSATCIRIPIFRVHSESIYLELQNDITLDEIESLYMNFPGVQVINENKLNLFPMPSTTSHKDDVYIGRIRYPFPFKKESQKEIALWCCGDQIRKGAALNAVQIAEYLLRKDAQSL